MSRKPYFGPAPDPLCLRKLGLAIPSDVFSHAEQLYREAMKTLAEKLKEWLEEVGTNEKTMYRWLSQVG